MTPKTQFILVWLALIALLFVMFGLAHFYGHIIGTTVILLLAGVQMLLVLTFFMRLQHSSAIVRLSAAAGFVWLSFLFILAFSDYLMRQWH